jgi:hypothetical protein
MLSRAEQIHRPRTNPQRLPRSRGEWITPRIWVATLVLGVVVFLAFPGARFQAYPPTEYDVEAAYLYNLGMFVAWPAAAAPGTNSPFTICVIGVDPFGRVLDTAVAGEMIGAQSVVARRVANSGEALGCRILFVSSSEQGVLKEVLATVSQASVLTVSNIPDFVERGGIIQFVVENRKVRFGINLAAAERARLSLSSQLLKLAVRVKLLSSAETAR